MSDLIGHVNILIYPNAAAFTDPAPLRPCFIESQKKKGDLDFNAWLRGCHAAIWRNILPRRQRYHQRSWQSQPEGHRRWLAICRHLPPEPQERRFILSGDLCTHTACLPDANKMLNILSTDVSNIWRWFIQWHGRWHSPAKRKPHVSIFMVQERGHVLG